MPTATSRPRVILDTDTYNEVDDQFALAHLLLSPDQVELEAVHAAPFLNPKSTGPADGMERSFQEIHHVLNLIEPQQTPCVCRGSNAFLPGPKTPVESEAAHDLVERAMKPGTGKLYVAGIAAATNIASAILIEPKIIDRIVVVWLGGHASYWHTTKEFNLKQDIHAARILFEAGMPLIRLPCNPVASHIITSVAELREQLAPFSKLGAYLTEIVHNYAGNPPGWSKVIWDIAVSAWVINSAWVTTMEVPSPILLDKMTWGPQDGERKRHAIQEALSVDRNAIFADFFAKAKKAGQ